MTMLKKLLVLMQPVAANAAASLQLDTASKAKRRIKVKQVHDRVMLPAVFTMQACNLKSTLQPLA